MYTIAISSTTHAQEGAELTNVTLTFSCKVVNGVLSTVANTPQGLIPVLTWNLAYYPESGEDPLTRCTRVSGILQTYNQQGMLDYITTGVMNKQNVVCAATKTDSSCSRLLFTLSPEEDSSQIVKTLRDVIRRPSSQPPDWIPTRKRNQDSNPPPPKKNEGGSR